MRIGMIYFNGTFVGLRGQLALKLLRILFRKASLPSPSNDHSPYMFYDDAQVGVLELPNIVYCFLGCN